uniref:NADH-ubiquinone oxidoreductase chain 2 n=1 Tax=Osmia pedicornis TaxID=124293 RepID=A0A7G9XFH2_9HYME|nr:NADH dehydrogenase subunit 2 [Osmia pedicornis]
MMYMYMYLFNFKLFMKLTQLNLMMKFLFIILSTSIFFLENIFLKWMILEFFSLIFIGYLNFNNLNKIPSLIYFFISSISSLLIFMNFIYSMNYLIIQFKTNNLILMFSLFLKLGIFPFNLWMIYSFPFLSWNEIFFFSTFAKIIPINLISSYINFNFFLLMFLTMNSIIASIFILEEMNLKKILVFSSMNHSSYLIFISFFNSQTFIFYFIIYLLNTFLLIYLLEKMNFKNKIFTLNLNSMKNFNYLFIIIIFSYSMLPPFSSFMAKWFFFNENILIQKSIFFLIILAISSVIMTWSYLNIMNYQFTLSKITKKSWLKFPKFYFKNNFNLILTFYLIFFFNFYLFIF